MPLGIMETDDITFHVDDIVLEKGDRIFIYSDGLIETEGEGKELYTQERLENHFDQVSNAGELFQTVMDDYHTFAGNTRQNDDVTIMEIICDQSLVHESILPKTSHKSLTPAKWDMSLNIDSQVMRNVDPLPVLMNMISDIQGLEDHRGNLFTVLAEMYSNALEHGMLGLASDLKKDADGFARYYQLRQQKLDELEGASLSFTFHHEVDKEHGRLNIGLTHNGTGFDHENHIINVENKTASGRGITLIKSICEDVNYTENGNQLNVSYKW